MIRNPGWYALNSTRYYPLDDQATGTTDTGEQLPQDLLADLNVRFPSTLGSYLFISACSVSQHLITVTFLAARHSSFDGASGDAVGDFVPVAAVTVSQADLIEGRMYPLDPLSEGVGGWIAFGSGVADLRFRGIFSGPAQSLIALRCARSYTPLPVSSLAKIHRSTTLTGVVTLRGGADLIVEPADRVIDGEERRVIVLRLDTSNGNDVYARYTGPCGGRPETGTCDKPGIERVGGAVPDCDGNVELAFEGGDCVGTYPFEIDGVERGGLAVDFCYDMTTLCTQAKRLPDADGNLPGDYTDLCDAATGSVGSSESLSAGSSESLSSESLASESSLVCADSFPYTDYFDDQTAAAFEVQVGTFGFYALDSPTEAYGNFRSSSYWSFSSESSECGVVGYSESSQSSESVACRQVGIPRRRLQITGDATRTSYGPSGKSSRNVSLWSSCAMETSVPFTLESHILIPSQADSRNGGFVLNYRTRSTDLRQVFYLVELNARSGAIEVYRYTGFAFTAVPISSIAAGVLADHWHALRVQLEPPSGLTAEEGSAAGNVRLVIDLWDAETEAYVTGTTITISDGTFGPYTGQHGLGSRNSQACFSHFRAIDGPPVVGIFE